MPKKLSKWLHAGIKTISIGLLVMIMVSFAKSSILAQNDVDFPDHEGFVNDFSDILQNDEELEKDLKSFAEEESTEIFVITIDELPEGTDISNFVPRLTDANSKWRAGQEKYDNGIILTVVMKERKMAIDVGYGLEGALPDLTAQKILDNEVRPHFIDEEYEKGIKAGVDAIKKSVKGEYDSQDQSEGAQGSVWGQIVTFIIVGGFFVIPYTAAFLARSKSWWLGGVLGFLAGIIISLVSVFALSTWVKYLSFLFLIPGLTVAGLFFDFILSRNYKKRKKKGLSTSWVNSFGGFSSGSSFGSSSSSGGFSGGSGGSFGGGGARSSW